jgi:hypothetical protein
MNILTISQNYSIVLSFNKMHAPKNCNGSDPMRLGHLRIKFKFSTTTKRSLSVFRIIWYLSSELSCKRDGTSKIMNILTIFKTTVLYYH